MTILRVGWTCLFFAALMATSYAVAVLVTGLVLEQDRHRADGILVALCVTTLAVSAENVLAYRSRTKRKEQKQR